MKYVIDGLNRYTNKPSDFKICDYNENDKELILNYMASIEPDTVGAGYIDDCRTGKQVRMTYMGYQDDEYIWSNQDMYHIEKYNAAVDPGFINHVKHVYMR